MDDPKRFIPVSLIGACAFVMAGAGSMAFSEEGAAYPVVKDVRIGERGAQSRIVLFCDPACGLKQTGEATFLAQGAGDRFTIDMSSQSGRLKTMKAEPGPAGSRIAIAYDGALEASSAKPCAIQGSKGVCIDLYFKEGAAAKAPAPAPSDAPVAAGREAPADARDRMAGLRSGEGSARAAAPAKRVAPPALRESSGDRLQRFTELAAPERIAPPNPPILAKVQPIERAVPVATPTLRTEEGMSAQMKVSFAARYQRILGKNLTPAYCNNAEATLQTDAWALGAMVDVGLCAAVRGDTEEAEAILSRLLKYTPDNYEALVGRAVIAEQAGERGAAKRYYQEALKAPPPVAESARILEAMRALS